VSKAKAKARATGAASQLVGSDLTADFSIVFNDTSGSDQRVKTVLDDFLCSKYHIRFSVRKDYGGAFFLDASDTCADSWQSTNSLVDGLFLEFLWNGEVAVNSKLFKVYSALRPELQSILVMGVKQHSVGESATPVSSARFAKMLKDMVSGGVKEIIGADDDEVAANQLAEMLTSEWVPELKHFISDAPWPCDMARKFDA
jgi:hypothetical protein